VIPERESIIIKRTKITRKGKRVIFWKGAKGWIVKIERDGVKNWKWAWNFGRIAFDDTGAHTYRICERNNLVCSKVVSIS